MRIAISGKMASGKSITATYLAEKCGFKELSFASKMKEIASDLFPQAKYEKNRMLLIQVGERLRELDNQVWIRYVLRGIVPGEDVVVSDVRFPAEYEVLQRLGFIMVRMYVSLNEQLKWIRKMYPDMPLVLMDDYSETALDHYPFDYTLDNDVPTLEELYLEIDQMIAEVRNRD